MVETALVIGLIAILMVGTFWIVAQWSAGEFKEQSTGSDKKNEMTEEIESLSGSVTVNSTTVATTSSVSGGM